MRKNLSVSLPNRTPGLPLRDEIAQRAYELWEHNGCPEGRDVDHWLTAERELLGADPQMLPTPAGAVRSPELAAAISDAKRGHPQNPPDRATHTSQ